MFETWKASRRLVRGECPHCGDAPPVGYLCVVCKNHRLRLAKQGDSRAVAPFDDYTLSIFAKRYAELLAGIGLTCKNARAR